MTQMVKNQEIIKEILYSKHEAAQLFCCLSTDIQDDLLSVMREMVAKNKAARDS